MSDRNIRLLIEYDGSAYAGWQAQAVGLVTIQTTIEEAIFKVTGERVRISGAGRTDAGVHAIGQVANFVSSHDIEPRRFALALNYHLPNDIHIRQSDEVPANFDSRRNATFRRYRYLIGRRRSALYRSRRWEYTIDIDFDCLQRLAGMLHGEYNFASFCVTTSRKEDNTCCILFARWYQIGELWSFEIRANRFLHGMVRSLVGGMVNAATCIPDANPRNLTPQSFQDILQGSTDERVVFTAPAQGLYLVSVGYHEGMSE
ncbi:MAG: tRNA pseudouridine(38-40) synthase TruA [Candidatus Zixiibacteriota bacterium]